MKTWMCFLPTRGLLIASVLSVSWLLAGCDEDATGESASEPAGSAGGLPARSTAGTLVLGGTTYELRGIRCDLEGDFDTADGDGTLSSSGQLDDGTRFTVTVGRSQVMAPYIRHEVWAGALSAQDRFAWTAEREDTPQGWRGEGLDGPAPDEPLVHIDGKTVTASGMFFDTRPGVPDSDRQDPVPGRLEATCR